MRTEDAHVPGGRDAATAAPHWHLVGKWWRPLHEQLGALRDAGVWMAAVGQQSSGGLTRYTGDGPSDMTIGVAHLGAGFAAVTVSGPLDVRTVHYLRGQLHLLLDAGVRDLVVDLAEASRCDLRFAAVLLTLRARLQARHGTLVISNPPVAARRALAVGRLPDSFLHCPELSHRPGAGTTGAQPADSSE